MEFPCPITPPEKRSPVVTFNLPADFNDKVKGALFPSPTLEKTTSLDFNESVFAEHIHFVTENTQDNLFDTLSPPLADLSCLEVSDDILVAMKDREKEIRELVEIHQEWFDMVKHTVCSEPDLDRFLKILFTSRGVMPDREWLNSLSEFLLPNRSLLEKFKELVGYNLGIDMIEQASGDPYYDSKDMQSGNDDDDKCLGGTNDGDGIEIETIQNYPEKSQEFKQTHPKSFNNVEKRLNNDKSDIKIFPRD